jgi:hypothetical protein
LLRYVPQKTTVTVQGIEPSSSASFWAVFSSADLYNGFFWTAHPNFRSLGMTGHGLDPGNEGQVGPNQFFTFDLCTNNFLPRALLIKMPVLFIED